MKVLLTTEEYRERAIGLVMEVAKETLRDEADDFFKYKFIRSLSKDCFEDRIGYMDEENRMFNGVFRKDRDGNPLDAEAIRRIGTREAKEFESQEWYAKRLDERKKRKIPYRYMYEYKKMFGEEDSHRLRMVEDAISLPFKVDPNSALVVADEAFRRLYGHRFRYNEEKA